MHTENPRVLKNLIKQLAPYVEEQAVEIPEWISYTGVHTAPNHIELDGKPSTVMRIGDRYDIGYDDTRYFEAEVTVPEDFAGRKVYLVVDFGGEALVRINGEIVGAVSSRENHGWVGRDVILFREPLKAGEKLAIQLENAVDCGGFCDTAMAGGTHMTYTLKTARLSLINEAAESFDFDMRCAWDVYEHTEDRYVAKRLYNAIDDAMHMADYDMGKDAFYASLPAAAERFWAAAAKIRFATPGEVIMAGHSHLDIAWLWTTRELNRKTARTFSNNLALMDAYPDFRFTQSQAIVYWFMKERWPDIFERVKEKVKSGQWEITGNTWVEADTNIASGESLVRQLLYGREFFMREFGVSSDIYWLPDCFGFTAALPQIIKKSGMKYFITSKLQNNDTNEFPVSAYKWRSHSGDEVLAFMQKVGYGGEGDAAYLVRARATNRQNDLTDVSMGMFGYGDGGGGCTYQMVETLRRMQKLPGLPEVRMGAAKEFFAALEKDADKLPVWDGEMYYENHRGTYTSQAFIKKNNRRGEFALRNIEMLGLLSGDYPDKELDEAWHLLLQNQFHDILPGTSIHEAVEDTRADYARLAAMYAAMKDCRLAALTAKAARGDDCVVVWNFHTHKLTSPVTVAVPDGFKGIADENDRPMNATVKDGMISFIADDVPGLGYKVFTLTKQPCGNAVTATATLLENEYLRVTFDENGLIDSVYDKLNHRETLTGKGNLLTISHDKPVHESAWNLESDYRMKMCPLTEAESIEVTESSAVKGEIKIVRKYHESVVTQYISLKAGCRTLDFATEVDWHEREKVLKAEFPVNVRARYSTFEIAHGALERPTYANNPFEKAMFECCAHKWTDLSEGGWGVSLLNDCKYGYDLTGNVMRITLMRGPVCPDPKGDIGVNTFTYALFPHAGDWRQAGTVKEAFRLNLPLEGYYVAHGDGTDGEKAFIRVSAADVIVDAVKKAQDGDGVILRVYEAEGRRGDVTVTLPCPAESVTENNLMEEPTDGAVAHDGDSFTFSIKPFEVRTFRIR